MSSDVLSGSGTSRAPAGPLRPAAARPARTRRSRLVCAPWIDSRRYGFRHDFPSCGVLREIITAIDMHELADDAAGIIRGEEHDDVRDVLCLRQPSSVFPCLASPARCLSALCHGGPHGGSPYPFLSDLSSLSWRQTVCAVACSIPPLQEGERNENCIALTLPYVHCAPPPGTMR